ncbi:MAG: AAA family ATPase [Proteobacteria bacterium]|nr:AAA family ATPase [Pseudomonadota bacterium]
MCHQSEVPMTQTAEGRQLCLWFFGPYDSLGRVAPTDDQRRWLVSRDNPSSPFSRFVGNERAVRKLQAAAFKALGDPNHIMRELAFSVYGPASAGKTTLARLYAQVVELPFCEVSPKQVRRLDDVFNLMGGVLREAGVPLVPSGGRYRLPPCVIFFDEVHALNDHVVQGLLKATEHGDGIMATESGRVVDCRFATWFIATTDEGRLFDAFKTRFSPVQLSYLTRAEIARIVGLAHPHLAPDVCALVAFYNGRVPRKALEFARYMGIVRMMEPGKSWEEVARQVAEDEGIDEFGMHEMQLRVLRALAGGAVASKRLPTLVGRKKEEVEGYILPTLMCETEDQPALVSVSNKGYVLTEAGVGELARRGVEVAPP